MHRSPVKLTIFIAAAVAALAGCSRPGIKGDGVIISANRPISDFSGLTAAGAYKIIWSSGQPAFTISTDQNLVPLIKTSFSGNTLRIDCEGTVAPTKGITINVSSSSLSDVQLAGAIHLTAAKLAGPGLKLESSGASLIKADGSVANLEANFAGACKLDARSLQTETATISLAGASHANVHVTGTLKASIAGAGVLTYSGNPKSVEKDISGAGSIRPRP
jgi:uncharacterized protein YjbI with pentapeptide repeats